jgi:hypothetical protein
MEQLYLYTEVQMMGGRRTVNKTACQEFHTASQYGISQKKN